MNRYNILSEIIACPVCSTDLPINDADTRAMCRGCKSTFIKGSYVWDFIPRDIAWSSPMWCVWQQLQDNGMVSYQLDPEHNLSVKAREDIRCFTLFCNCRGLVLDVGCGPQSWPSYFRRAEGTTYIGVDPLIEDIPGKFIRIRALAEFLPFRTSVFDQVLFGTSLDHFVDPIAALRAAAKVCKPDGEINVWVGEKSLDAPKPAISPEWYQRLRKPDLAEDLFHIKRLSQEAFINLAEAADLTLVQTEINIVDNFRTNYFYRLKTSK